MADHISICICTYRRPALLQRLLDGLRQQKTNGLFTYSIVVTDNDASASAQDLVAQFERVSGIPVTYCVEPVQSISLARNRAVSQAQGEFIAFIDDDEFPIPEWLLTLYQARQRFNVDGVLGPVKPHFDVEPPAWVSKGGFYDRPTYKTGFVIDWRKGRTGNVLLRRSLFDGLTEPFRKQFGSGAEDQDFFRRMIEKGHRFVWCNEALAYEVVPPLRWSRRFMLKRALLRGKVSLNHPTTGITDVLKSMIAVPGYAVALPVVLLVGQHTYMKVLVKFCDHAGRLLAWIGIDPVKDTYVTE